MNDKHTVLLVEDDLRMAKQLGDLITSLGHNYVHTTNQEEAQAIVERGEPICYALLDLQIKVAENALMPEVEVGQNLLSYLRGRYPKGNDRVHHLPILVMSGHAKDMPTVIKSLQDGAEDFILKPLSKNRPGFAEKIREALRKSARESHQDCALANLRAVGEPKGVSEIVAKVTTLEITGRLAGRRVEIRLGGQTTTITNASFLLLLRLVHERLKGGQGWVHKNDLGARTEAGWKGVARLKDEVRCYLPPGADPTENDMNGRYRLHSDVTVGPIDTGVLATHDDGRITSLARSIAELRAVPTKGASKRSSRQQGAPAV